MSYLNSLYFRFRNSFSNRFPHIYFLCNKHKSVIKFFIVGSSAGATDLVFLFLFYGYLKWEIVFSTSLAFILSFLVSFTLQKLWTFRNYNHKQTWTQLALYLLNAFVGLSVNGFLMHALVNKFNIWYLLAQIIVNIFIGVYNFIIFKFIIFKSCENEDNSQQKTIGESAGNLA